MHSSSRERVLECLALVSREFVTIWMALGVLQILGFLGFSVFGFFGSRLLFIDYA